MITKIRAAAAVVALALTGAMFGATPALATAAGPTLGSVEACHVLTRTWGSTAKAAGSLSPAPGTFQRVGQHPCFDRLVFHFRGSANGYRVQYQTNVITEAKGDVLPLKGGAKIGVHLLDNTDHVSNVSVARFRTFRDVKFGGSFEGYSTFGLGVRARLPFRVFTLHGVGSDYTIVVDVAHNW